MPWLCVFQVVVEKALYECIEFARSYIDDIVVFLSNWKEHLGHIGSILAA